METTNLNEKVEFKNLGLADGVSGKLKLKDGNIIVGFGAFAGENYILPLDIYHVYRADIGESQYGKNFRLNIEKKLKVSQDDTVNDTKYVFTDELGEERNFEEKYYYIDTGGTKNYISKSAVEFLPDGDLRTGNKKVYVKQLCGDYTLIPELNDFKGVERIEQRHEQQVELQENVNRLEAKLKEYTVVSGNTGTKISGLETLTANDYKAFINNLETIAGSIAVTKAEGYRLRALYKEYNNAQSDAQKNLAQEQITDIKKRAQNNFAALKEEFKKYIVKKAELDQILKQVSVNYLKDKNGVINGFNRTGALVLVADAYGNYLNFHYDEENLLTEISDNNNRLIKFEYKNGLLADITDFYGRQVKYSYDALKRLTKITYPDKKTCDVTYNANDTIAAVIAANGEHCAFTYNGIKLSNLTIKKSGLQVSSVSISYAVNSVTLSTNRGAFERYKFDSENRITEYAIGDELKRETVKTYRYIDGGKRVSVVTTDNVSSKPLTEIRVYDGMGMPRSEETEWHNITDNTIESTKILYEYDSDNRLNSKTTLRYQETDYYLDGETVDSFSDKLVEKYSYDGNGNLIFTESYVEGEEKTTGINYEQRVYNDSGIMVKCIRWNSLDSSSKFYEECEREENGRVKYEKDETGAYAAMYEYADGTKTVSGITYANGGRVGYGRNRGNGEITSVTYSTAEGEANENEIEYAKGAPVKMQCGDTILEYAYDGKGRKTQIKVNGKVQATYTYNDVIDYNSDDDYYDFGGEDETLDTGSGKITKKITRNGNGGANGVATVSETVKIGADELSSRQYDEKGLIINETYYTEDRQLRQRFYVYDTYGKPERIITRGGTSTQALLQEDYSYDERGDLTGKTYTGNVNQTYRYGYSSTASRELESVITELYNFKALKDVNGRNTGREITSAGKKFISEHITYRKLGDRATNMPSGVQYKLVGNAIGNIKYKYDTSGNIREITENGQLKARYTYDGLNRIIREDNKGLNKTEIYGYDNAGNISERTEYEYTESVVTPSEVQAKKQYGYVYDGDKLIEISISGNKEYSEYNNIGNPVKYRGKECEWQYGKRLTKYGSTAYAYDSIGRRTKKGSITYTYDSEGRLLKQSNGLEYLYDLSGVAVVKYNGTRYFYRKDAQGNIAAILYDNGAVAAKYEYDAWGKHKVVDASGNEITSGIGVLNPFRYRGYYYDTETGLYYLQTRYYDPEVGRFISQDSLEYAAPETINGLNLYAYCLNNPVMMTDETGNMPRWLKWLLGGIALIGAVVLTVVTGGAVAPVLAGFAGSVLIGGIAQGAVTAISGGNFWDGFLEGAADGALWGGIFAFAGASIGATKYFASVKGAVKGTKHLTTIQAGQQFERYGSLYGKYLTEVGTSISKLALPPTNSMVNTTLQATRKFRVYVSTIAPAFGSEGGGIQYIMRYPIAKLLKKGWLIIIG